MTEKQEKAPKKKEDKPKKKSPLETLKDENKQLKDDYLRLRADFDNFRKRKELEIEETRDRSISNFVSEILPSIDNFEMSLKMTDNSEMFVKGVEMIHKNLIDTLKEHKIESFEPKLLERFNPELHEPVPVEEGDSGVVLAVLKKGYKHKEKVLRPARINIRKEEN